MVSDLQHFLDLPPETPGPARRLAAHLGAVVKAATAGDAGTAWETALSCRRRPAHRPCPGRMIVARTEPDAPVHWRCSACSDAGSISNWADSLFDLRRRHLTLAGSTRQIIVPDDVAAALRDLALLDTDAERLVYRMRHHDDGAALATTDDELDDLIGSLAAEANHEPDRRRRQRLDTALDTLEHATADGR
jgi:hypothetical protein